MLNDVTPPDWQRPKPKTIKPPEKPMALPLHEQARAEDPLFKTPEQVAAEPVSTEPQVVLHAQPAMHWWRRLHGPRSRKMQIVCGVSAIVLVFGLGFAWTKLHPRQVVAEKPKTITKKVVPPPKIIYSTLSGLPVADNSVNQRPVIGVMVENSEDARPQSGLDKAGVVFEAVAEGGITRFLALYQDTQPEYIGPVRSVRPYYLEWSMGFDAAIAHVGGSPEALQDVKTWGVKDLDQFFNSKPYYRLSSRYAPHNMYSSVIDLSALAVGKGFTTANYTGLPRKTEQGYKASAPTSTTTPAKKTATPADTRTPATSINIVMSGPLYDSHYDYDTVTNSYKRSEGGAPHMQLNKDGSQVQLSPKVVVALAMQYGIQSDGKHSDYNVIGSGTAYVFQDGTVTTGTWQKSNDKEQITLLDAAGAPLKLNPGQTWFTAVSAANRVTYK